PNIAPYSQLSADLLQDPSASLPADNPCFLAHYDSRPPFRMLPFAKSPKQQFSQQVKQGAGQ
ncbi:MAG: hypothetical protein ACKPJJ_20075, partial [Planctomycetaceae bacterium]